MDNDELAVFENRSIFSIPSQEVFIRRSVVTLVASPKIFMAAFTWEGFGFLGTIYLGLSNYSTGYYFLTGLGTFLGVFCTHFLTLMILQIDISSEEFATEMQFGFILAVASGIAAGTLWQYSVNVSYNLYFNFTGAFFFVFLLSATAFFVAIVIIRQVNQYIPKDWRLKISSNTSLQLWCDFLLALSVGSADAFFVGTDNGEFRNGWLYFVNVSSSTSVANALALSGSSGLIGFLLMQTLQNLILTTGWVDVSYTENLTVKTSSERLSEIYSSAENLLALDPSSNNASDEAKLFTNEQKPNQANYGSAVEDRSDSSKDGSDEPLMF